MSNTLEVINQIKEIAKSNSERNEVHKTREFKALHTGKCYRQGDIYVFKVSNDHRVGAKLDRRQIADGVSLGARHVLVGDFHVYEGVEYPCEVNDLNRKANCLGYAFDVLTPGAINTHPEHDNFKLMECGRYQVVHQVDYMTLRRVAD